jgi:hypothetical protein
MTQLIQSLKCFEQRLLMNRLKQFGKDSENKKGRIIKKRCLEKSKLNQAIRYNFPPRVCWLSKSPDGSKP